MGPILPISATFATVGAGVIIGGKLLSPLKTTGNETGTYNYNNLPDEVKTILEANHNIITKFYLYRRAV